MVTDKTNHTIKLKDGRMLGYAEYGNPEGKPVFYFHGFPGSWPTDNICHYSVEFFRLFIYR